MLEHPLAGTQHPLAGTQHPLAGTQHPLAGTQASTRWRVPSTRWRVPANGCRVRVQVSSFLGKTLGQDLPGYPPIWMGLQGYITWKQTAAVCTTTHRISSRPHHHFPLLSTMSWGKRCRVTSSPSPLVSSAPAQSQEPSRCKQTSSQTTGNWANNLEYDQTTNADATTPGGTQNTKTELTDEQELGTSDIDPRKFPQLFAIWCAKGAWPFSALGEEAHQGILHPIVLNNLPTQKAVSQDIGKLYNAVQDLFIEQLKNHTGAMYLGLDAWQLPNGFDVLGTVIYRLVQQENGRYQLDAMPLDFVRL
ncbi:hypothetical protein PCANC_06756 [Puccinia coronata f. sp. avenae]|uniref:Uncharacterized protein n=1 Tax=Puccinia coronata f. sp. avenae TaxID=200324 RepID=A0A2N5VDP6_9BASI|nr:hypothetical protein PCANC_06756 [Puccinia coronata f. sp. avenae]